jgi:hypothetical protein
MRSVSKPLLGLLAAVVIVAVLWTVALSPGGGAGGSGGSSGGLGAYQSDINKARASAAAQDAPAANGSGQSASPSGASPAPASSSVGAATGDHSSAPSPIRSARGAGGPAAVTAALKAGRVVAILFYNPGAADDEAERAELQSIPNSARLLRLAVPISQVADYPAISLSVPIQTTPTLVIVNPRHQATVIPGFEGRFAIAAQIRAALS